MVFSSQMLLQSMHQIADRATQVVDRSFQFVQGQTEVLNPVISQFANEAQKKALFCEVLSIVENLDHPEIVEPHLQELGRTFNKLGVFPEHYALLGKCFIVSLRRSLDQSWSSNLEDLWIKALAYIADKMLEGVQQTKHPVEEQPSALTTRMQSSEASLEADLRHAARQIAHSFLFQALDEELNDTFVIGLRRKVHELVTDMVQQELKTLLSRGAPG